jgi:hypothetical protein
MNRANMRPQRSDKRQVSWYHLFRLVPRAIQHACDDYPLSVTVALRPVNATFSMYSFRCAPAEMLSTKRIHASKPFETADHSVERADGR